MCLTITDYVLEFCTIVTGSEWNNTTLKATFHRSLNPEVLTELACQDKQLTLDVLTDLAIRLDRLLHSHCQLWSEKAGNSDTSEPMQLGRTRLSKEERER